LEKLGFKQRNGSYDYLLSTPLWNLTQEKIDKLNSDRDKREKEYKILLNTDALELWREDLLKLQEALQVMDKQAKRVVSTTKNTTKKLRTKRDKDDVD